MGVSLVSNQGYADKRIASGEAEANVGGSAQVAAAVGGGALAVAKDAVPNRDLSPKAGAPLLDRGRRLFEEQDYEQSIQTLTAALLKAPNDSAERLEILRLLAFNYVTLGRLEEADGAARALFCQAPDFVPDEHESPRFRDFFRSARTRWESDGRPGQRGLRGVESTEVLAHTPPVEVDSGKPMDLVVRLGALAGRVAQVRLSYRKGIRGKYTESDGVRDGDLFRFTVPGKAVEAPIVDYFFTAFGDTGLPVTARGDADAPIRVAVREPPRKWIVPLAVFGGVVGAAAIVGGLAVSGVFSSQSGSPGGEPRTIVNVSVVE